MRWSVWHLANSKLYGLNIDARCRGSHRACHLQGGRLSCEMLHQGRRSTHVAAEDLAALQEEMVKLRTCDDLCSQARLKHAQAHEFLR